MKKTRLFIKNLPEKATQDEIEAKFADYGKVLDVKVQERKHFNTVSDQSRYFAYINIKTDDNNLQKCFADFNNNLWHEQEVEVQVAKESFLDQLKREREESSKTVNSLNHAVPNNIINSIAPPKKIIIAVDNASTKFKTTDISLLEKKSTVVISPNKTHLDIQTKNESTDSSPVNNKCVVRNGLPKSQSEIRRLQSVNQMVTGYKKQKAAVKTALSAIDFKPQNKIIFDDEMGCFESDRITDVTLTSDQSNRKKRLFEDDEDVPDDKINFEVNTIFEGKKGKELYELQSKYKNDKRFILDERFKDDEQDEGSNKNPDVNLEDITIEEEKQRQYEILKEVLGNKAKQKDYVQNNKRSMLRFDPAQYEHKKFEIEKDTHNKKEEKHDKKTQKNENDETLQVKVSKEAFYKVTDDLKEVLQEDKGFSLLNLFGNSSEVAEEHVEETDESIKDIKSKKSFTANPFKYDSSEDEEFETEQSVDSFKKTEQPSEVNSSKFWFDSFFLKDDDYRLQEGFDFVKRMASKNKDEFTQVRRKLKEIVKMKLKNNQRKNKPFKKKLGGSKRKKMIRIKKAMKR